MDYTNGRFYSRIERDPSGCWLWTGARNRDGYGQLWLGRIVYVHRWAYERFVGPIPEGLEIDHLCRVPACCNPAHLEPVTHAENIRRGYEAKAQTHCKRGHELADAYVTRDGRRDCRACARIRAAARRSSESTPGTIRIEVS